MLVEWWFNDTARSGSGIDAAAGSEIDVVSVCVLVIDAADAGSNSTSDGSVEARFMVGMIATVAWCG